MSSPFTPTYTQQFITTAQPNRHISPFPRTINTSMVVPGYIHLFFLFFYYDIKYQLLDILKITRENNQQDVKIVDLDFVKSK